MRGAGAQPYHGTDRLIVGIVLAVIMFWLFAQTTVNVAPVIRDALGMTTGMSDLALSITALFSESSSSWPGRQHGIDVQCCDGRGRHHLDRADGPKGEGTMTDSAMSR